MTTRGAKQRGLSDTVFLATELLEKILLQLPMKDLLLAQQVCRKWKAVISESRDLQTALYLLPSETLFRWNYQFSPKAKLTRISLSTPHQYNVEGTSYMYSIATLNSLLCKEIYAVDIHNKVAILRYDGFQFNRSLAVGSPTASWQEMFLTQPPITKASVACYFRGQSPAYHAPGWIDVANSAGIKMWDIINVKMWDIINATTKYRLGAQICWGTSHVHTDRTILVSDSERQMTDGELQAITDIPLT